MDCHNYITNLPERKRGQHLQREERGAIQALKGKSCPTEQLPRYWDAPRPPSAAS